MRFAFGHLPGLLRWNVMMSPSSWSDRRVLVAIGLMVASVLLLILPFEIPLWSQVLSSPNGLAAWMQLFIADTSPYILWMIALPAILLLPMGWFCWVKPGSEPGMLQVWLTAWGIGLVTFINLALVASYCDGLPPAVHDEYSYLFQAETFINGRLTNPGLGEDRKLVDMMHVLNISDGHFASRYFPGVGVWVAPFLAFDMPYVSNWVACAITAMLAFGIGREIGGYWTGVVAGLLTSCSPTIEFFSNMILSHHATLMGLYLFIFCLMRFWKYSSRNDLLLASLGLTVAMLSRPLTALAVCLPFAVAYLFWLVRQSREKQLASAMVSTGLFVTPIALGMGFMLVYNQATTGSMTTTPYSQYTEYYTPRHVFGFDNRVKGEEWIAKAKAENLPIDVIENYDIWAENLDAKLAWTNLKNRVVSNLKWTWGPIPLVVALVVFVTLRYDNRSMAWLLLASAVLLYVVHIPYWFDGMFHYHYVYEAGPLLLIIAAVAIVDLVKAVSGRESKNWLIRPQWSAWLIGMFLIAWVTAHTSLDPLWNSWLHQGIGNLQFARGEHAKMNKALDTLQKPAVAIIRQKPEDRHLDYVINLPTLDGPVLRVRYLPEKCPPEKVAELFPRRYVYLVDLVERKITPVSAPRQESR
jgi:hypothetical protein